MAKNYQELKDLQAYAKSQGVSMSQLGKRGGDKAARLARERKAKEEKKKKADAKPKQTAFNFESFYCKFTMSCCENYLWVYNQRTNEIKSI